MVADLRQKRGSVNRVESVFEIDGDEYAIGIAAVPCQPLLGRLRPDFGAELGGDADLEWPEVRVGLLLD